MHANINGFIFEETKKGAEWRVCGDGLCAKSMPRTDLWQKTYYGFSRDNAPCLLATTNEKYFTFTVRTEFEPKTRFDQCGVLVYQSPDCWLKASAEYENEDIMRLGSVVTNNGFSDWATTDIGADVREIHYRLSRRGSDFLVESSFDGKSFRQMRIARLSEADGDVRFGIYICSPGDGVFGARFDGFFVGECVWKAETPDAEVNAARSGMKTE